jgi:ketosteroid isomerase-like protein
MKNPLPVLIAFFLAILPAIAADDPQLAAVKAADTARVAAMKSPDRERLNAIFSNELRYSHSTGAVDTKASFIELLLAGKTRYVGYDYDEQNFTFPAPGIALMTGRLHLTGINPAGPMDIWLNFLAVWREESGHWRFLSWQSCKVAPPTVP